MSKYKIIFLGTPEFAVAQLEAIAAMPEIEIEAVFSQPARRVGRKQILIKSAVQQKAEDLGLSVYTPERFSTPEVEQLLKKLEPDLVLVSAFGEILSQAVLDIPRLGFVNVHGSLLPRWRGASPVQSAILAGDTETGVSIQQVVYALDAGDILLEQSLPITSDDSSETLMNKLSILGSEILKKYLLNILRGEISPRAQDESQATFCKKIKKEAGIVDPARESAQEIERKIRAFTPWPRVSFRFAKLNIQILKAELVEAPEYTQPGELTVLDQSPLLICHTGALRLIQIKPEGKQAMSGSDFVRGYLRKLHQSRSVDLSK